MEVAIAASEVMAIARARRAARSAPPVGDLVITLREEGLRAPLEGVGSQKVPSHEAQDRIRPARSDDV